MNDKNKTVVLAALAGSFILTLFGNIITGNPWLSAIGAPLGALAGKALGEEFIKA